MTTKLNVGLLGAGHIGRVDKDLAYRIPAASVAAVADTLLEAAEECSADYQIPSDPRPARYLQQ